MFTSSLRQLVICLWMVFLFASLEGVRNSKPIYSGQQVSEQESKLIAIVNQERKNHGLGTLLPWKILSYHAREHSQDMANQSVDFGHAGFQARAQAIQNTANCYSVGENVAYCYLIDDPLKTSLELWMKSPHHRDNILGDYKETGIGIAYDEKGRCFITQLFSKRRY